MSSTLEENSQIAERLLDREWTLRIGGKAARAASGKTFEVLTPYGERRIASVPDGGREDAHRAIDLAAGPAARWAATPIASRSAALHALASAIEERATEIAVLDAIDSGAPVSVMRRDVDASVASLRYFAGLAMEAKGFTVPASAGLHFTEHSPFGVVVKIIPFNHPFLFGASKIAAPLAAGNAVVLKPAETTPLSALLLGELCDEVLPPGLVSVVVGDGPEVPDALVRHPAVRRIGFTGSDTVGRRIQAAAAEVAIKTISLELGGKNALIAYPDADPEAVAAGAIAGMNFTWSGQSCGSTSRVLVHEDIADDVLDAVTTALEGREFLSPLDPAAVQGTMVNRRQYERVLGYLDIARTDGATVVTGGKAVDDPAGGLFIEPTFLEVPDSHARVAREEIFGPIVSVIRWRDAEKAIEIANSVDYGLTGSVYSNDIGLALGTARALDTGYVWINHAGPHYLGLPYGGRKDSGLGSEESLDELLSYTQSKSVSIVW